MVIQVDKDGTGSIDFPEFLMMMAQKVWSTKSWILVILWNMIQKYCKIIYKLNKNVPYKICFKINSENAEDEVREAFKVFDGVRYKTWEKSPKVSNIQSIQPTLWRDGCLYIDKSPSSPPSLSRSTLNVIFCRMATGISTGMSSQSWWPTLGRS